MINTAALGFQIPSLGEVLTFAIRIFFIIAGLMALFSLLTGALAWITSGGDKGNVEKARDRIQAAVVGVILVVVVLSILVTMEQVVFAQRVCFGLSCPITIPSLLAASGTPTNTSVTNTITDTDYGPYMTPTPGPSPFPTPTSTPAAGVLPTPTGTPPGYSAPYGSPNGQIQIIPVTPTFTPTPTPVAGDMDDYLFDVPIFRR